MDEHYIQEKYSSAVTLSDMEIFIFPDLMYSLVLANIMSPCIWKWREDPWFRDFEKFSPMKKIQRLKQFIMNTYTFNLDLDTWGLTTKEREQNRFRDFIDINTLKQSNALFGYEGDKYYFDMDIRRHFGLDSYDSDIIPYWKTETVEAMNAFQYRENYDSPAGECVSLATLYAAALFIMAKIPLEDIFLMATPLHSQNYVLINDGVITNNRRIVTKAMWVNGTEISAKARRALENERVTVVCHNTGYIHTLFPDATIHQNAYDTFSSSLRSYLSNPLTPMILSNFVRHRRDIQKCFQVRWTVNNRDCYIESEHVFAYEMHSAFSFTAQTRKNLMAEIETEDFHAAPISSRIILNDLEEYVKQHTVNFSDPESVRALRSQFSSDCMSADIALENLFNFCHVQPRLPNAAEKSFSKNSETITLSPEMTREEIISHVESLRTKNTTADLAFYAYRDLSRIDYKPFIKACIERNPASVENLKHLPLNEVIDTINAYENESIYEGPGRLAQPDEVFNYMRGDGLEKAILAANIIRFHMPTTPLTIDITAATATVLGIDTPVSFNTQKGLPTQTWTL